jgi:NAD+ diphosphatase
MAYWHYRHRFCGDCGSPTRSTEGGHQRVCTNDQCKQPHFPRTDPAIIVIITSGKHCLLGRQRAWPKDLYSTIAGFVEPGESLEAAVVREIKEETGVQVDEVYYHSSQAWPFPGSIMLGFSAKTASKDVSLDINELEDARWLSREEMENGLKAGSLKLPSPVSIAFRLIEDWFNAESKSRLRNVISTS